MGSREPYLRPKVQRSGEKKWLENHFCPTRRHRSTEVEPQDGLNSALLIGTAELSENGLGKALAEGV